MACNGTVGAYLLLFSQALNAVFNGMDVWFFHSKKIIQLKWGAALKRAAR